MKVSIPNAPSQSSRRPAITNEEDFRRAMKELSNWGRWGDGDELGAANLITPAKREQALALAKEGLPVSLAHDVAQEKAADARNNHGIVHSHLDAVDCHMMVDGKGYNGGRWKTLRPRGVARKGISMYKDSVSAMLASVAADQTDCWA